MQQVGALTAGTGIHRISVVFVAQLYIRRVRDFNYDKPYLAKLTFPYVDLSL